MICQSDLTAEPGLYRTGWIGVRDAKTGEIVHEGVDRAELEPHIGELLAYVNEKTVESVSLRAAMTHLNLIMLHPFKDGNGRTARCIPGRARELAVHDRGCPYQTSAPVPFF